MTLSVSGTDRALWMMSSSLSIRTRTSILSNPPLGSLCLAAWRIDLRQAAGDGRRHQVNDGASERGDLSDAARAEEAVLGRSHHEHCFYVGRQLPIELRHGELVF